MKNQSVAMLERTHVPWIKFSVLMVDFMVY